jgi:hypothetical protein
MQPRSQSRFPRRRPGHALSARHQGGAQGDAAGGGQAADPVRGGRGLRRRHPPHDLRHRAQQARHRRPLRHRLRAGKRTRSRGKHELLAWCAPSARRHGLLLRAPAAQRWAWATRCCAPSTLVGDEPFAVLLADDLMVGPNPAAAGAGADGRPPSRIGRSSWRCRKCRPIRRGATASWPATPVNAADAHDHIVEKPAPENAPSRMGVAGPLHPDAGDLRGDPRQAARRGRRDPAHRRHRPPDGSRRSTPTSTRASATTAAARKVSSKPTWSWRCSTRRWARIPRVPEKLEL